MVTHKHALRSWLSERRAALTPRALARRSAAVERRALKLRPLTASRCIALYSHVRNEVATDLLFRSLLGKAKILVYPRVEKRGVAFHRVGNPRELVQGYAGIPEPGGRPATFTPVRAIDFFFVPGLAFDRRGYRLGYGAGMYDRALRRRRAGSVACGLCFGFQLFDRLPVVRHDQPVDWIVTEREVVCAHG